MIKFEELTPNGFQLKTIMTNFYDKEVEIFLYLPTYSKIKIIQEVLDKSIEQGEYFNQLKLDIYFNIALVKYYAGITFTDEELEDIGGTYDILVGSGLLDHVLQVIPEEEYNLLYKALNDTAKDVFTFNNSVMGVFRIIQQQSQNLSENLMLAQNKDSESPEVQDMLDHLSELIEENKGLDSILEFPKK